FGLLALLLFIVSAHPRPLAKDTVLVLHPQGQLVEQFSASPLARALDAMSGQATDQVRVRDLVAAIDHAANDADIHGILLMPGDLHAGGFAALREVGKALDRFRAGGKTVTAWAPDMDQYQYLLAAHADRVFIDPMGSVMVTGLASYQIGSASW